VKTDKIDDFIKNVERGYSFKIGYKPEFYVVEIGNGVRKI
jgi:galactokinase